ncbi:unnamed protein product [Rotaria sp. Silwood2]|nr:unnamed protein product [Rotaria sp. Silwood2]CAF2818736.1 unnamed protein product [Rotaria sp. Silwood2]CAF3054274.1 unnamed protein product [Rotaria sp. Silwood2]CAF3054292.1 unnamed protein product [Rotaria sp. Silwood2]CAF3192686.1 unnamed protein product [Rotaria sp. Silwood2]
MSKKPSNLSSKNSQSDSNEHRSPENPLLAQFAYATAPGYKPQPQATTSNSTASANQPTKTGSNTLIPLPAQPVNLATFKDLKFITLDDLLVETREIYDDISGTFEWEMCQNQEDRCINYIRDKCTNNRVFFITSGGLGKSIIPKIHDLPQVYAIYIYCADVLYHQGWACKFSKVRVVCNNDDQYLLPQFAVDVAQANMDWGDALLKDGKRDAAKKKFEKADENLTKHARIPDPVMVNQVKSKLAECK